jgi:RimJ/RimL family protein N-acetyltransferase
MCGLIKREGLDDVDIGFAFLPAFRGQGYALEAATATLEYGRDLLKLKRVVAIATPDNLSSIGLMKKIGMKFERATRLHDDAEELVVYAIEF